MNDAPAPAQKPLQPRKPAPGDWRQALPEDLTAPGRDESGKEAQIPLRQHPALAKYASAEEALKALVQALRRSAHSWSRRWVGGRSARTVTPT